MPVYEVYLYPPLRHQYFVKPALSYTFRKAYQLRIFRQLYMARKPSFTSDFTKNENSWKI